MRRKDTLFVSGVILPTVLVGSFGAFMIAFIGYAVETGQTDAFPATLTFLGFMALAVIIVSALTLGMHYMEHRRLEKALEREREFTSLVAHQLRQRFTSFTWGLDAVANADLTADDRARALEEMRPIADQGAKTVLALLRASRLERGMVTHQNTKVSAASVAEEAVSLLKERAAEHRATISLEVPADATITADPELAAEALRNVVDNAIIHGGAGNGITVRGTAVPNGYAIAVSDHGPGIPKEAESLVFQKSIATKAATKGAGIGLYITKTLMQLMGGDADFETSPQGTTFTLTFPSTR